MSSKRQFLKIVIPLLMSMTFFSCINMKKTTYFNDLHDGEIKSPEAIVPVIHKNDILSISVSSLNPDASAIFNAPNLHPTASSTSIGSTSQLIGYLVNDNGNIQFPVLGNVEAVGLSLKQLSENITKTLSDKKLLVDPIISIRFLNFRVTVLGEVEHPGVVPVSNERMSILEALGLAGDLTIYGKRDNVLLIREEEGIKIIKHIDLNSPETLTSAFYYLKSNDVIYVEPNKNKVRSASNSRQVLPILFSALSFLTIVASLAINKQL
jgi:polysaccharide biosynthesis/export protein